MNLIDRTLLSLSPKRAVSRAMARQQYDLLASVNPKASDGSETRWRGASRMLRSLRSWIPVLGSPGADLPTGERNTLIARSRDAHRGHLIARAAITRSRTNIVGTGLMRRSQVDHEALGISPEEADRLNQIIDREWALYAEDPREVDAEATLDHYQLQGLALISAMLSGDCFGLTPYHQRPGCLYGTKIQLVEADRVNNPNKRPNNDTLTDGVEFDGLGAPVRYWVQRTHPGDGLKIDHSWDPIPVFGAETGRRRVLHIWNDKERPSQARGAPYLAPILEPLQTLEKYSRAELMAAVVSAMLTVFIERTAEGEGDTDPLNPWGNGEEDDQQTQTQSNELALGNAAVLDLAPGEKANAVNPSRPNANYDPFFASMVRQMGAALELPFEELMLYYSSSYSAARAAMLQAWRFYTTRRWWLVVQFCQPSSELWFDEAVARGRIPVSGYGDPARRRAYTRALWTGPARGAIDELKEARAAGERINIGISNETIETAAMTGEDWATVYAQRVREVQARKRDGLWTAAVAETSIPDNEEPNQ